jgi:D-glycero-D-manno-heptose 1,7-bisphosphate phosphatase
MSTMPHQSASGFPRALRAVFLDRDGVLNEKMPEGAYVRTPAEFHPLPGVAESIARLNRSGLLVLVVTNQRGIARGLYTLSDVHAIHANFQQYLAGSGAHIDGFFICPHDKNQCNCRKPLPGLFEQAVAQFPQIAASTSVMMGDSNADIKFGRRLGMTTVYLAGRAEHRSPTAASASALADLRFEALPEAIDALLATL